MPARQSATFLEGLSFGEGPRWHDGRLWYSDLPTQTVWSVAEDGGAPRPEAMVRGRPSGLGWSPDGALLVVSMADRRVLRRESDGSLVVHGDLSKLAAFPANDMLVDGAGRAYVGNFGFDLDAFFDHRPTPSAKPARTALVRVDPDGTVHEAARDLYFPNGMALLPHGAPQHTERPPSIGVARILVVAETFASQLSAFDVDGDGELHHRRVWAPLDHCAPDGICADAATAIWVANAAAAECLRLVEGGEIVDRVTTSQPCFACALGGDDGRTLYCMTAPSAHASELDGRHLARIECVRVEVPYAPAA